MSDSTILLGYLFIYNFTQRDMEIPCRNEVDKVELPRAVAAFNMVDCRFDSRSIEITTSQCYAMALWKLPASYLNYE